MSRKVEDVNCLSSFYYSQSLPIQFLPNNPVGLSSLQTPERWISSFRALINLGLFLPGASCWHKAEVCQQDIKSNDRFLIKVFLALKKRHLRNRPFLPEMLICKNATVELQQRPAIGSRVCRHAVRGRERREQCVVLEVLWSSCANTHTFS